MSISYETRSKLKGVFNMLVVVAVISALSAYIWYQFYIPPNVIENWDAPGFPVGMVTPLPFIMSIMSCALCCFFLFYKGRKKITLCSVFFLAASAIIIALIIMFPDFELVVCANIIFYIACAFVSYRRKLTIFIFLVGLLFALLGDAFFGLIITLPSMLLYIAMLRASFTTINQSVFFESSYFVAIKRI